MSAQSSQWSISGNIKVEGIPAISAHKASNAIGFLRAFEKRRASGACGVRPGIDRSKPKGASSRDKKTEGVALHVNLDKMLEPRKETLTA